MKNFLNKKKYLLGTIAAFFVVVVSFQNCGKLDIQNLDNVQRTAAGVPVDVPSGVPVNTSLSIEDSAGYVCSAFGTTTVPSDKSGLKAELRFLDQGSTLSSGQKNAFLSTEYFNDKNTNFIKKEEAVFLNDVNVPTRIFNQGFQGSDGNVLEDNQGHALIEYFALRMESVLKLGPKDAPGYYELASIADDGSVVQIKENGQWVDLIKNDGAHSTQMGCTERSLKFDANTRLPIRIYYNQGPREHIANVLVWNYRGPATAVVSAATVQPDIHGYCGKASTDMFWIPASSKPNTWINDIYSKGWKVVGTENFLLPDNEVNPCAYSSYDVAPTVSYESITDLNKSITIVSSDSTILTGSLYLIHSDGSKELVKAVNLPEDIKHTFQTGNIILDQKYQLDVVLEVPAKKIKVLKSYKLKVSSTTAVTQ
ncbi:MAG: hypothetical protein H7256_09250 [Bdellovibrio sp.]|nr:hypothetical protein [Bdellovibrio sp.]